jgi:dolichyl-phosphate beta-glucosyltransferase
VHLSIIIPAYNEEDRLPITLSATRNFLLQHFPGESEMVIVDDGSIDDTIAITQKYADEHSDIPIRVLSYSGNRGKGYAVRYGMLHCESDWRLFCDADLATPIEEYQKLWDHMQKTDSQIGIGSRPLRQSQLMVRQPLYRELMGRTFNKVVQTLTIPGIQDTQCGFKLFSAQAAEDIFGRSVLDRFAFDAEALFIASRLGYKISETPIRWSHKDGSKVSLLRDGSKMVLDLLRIRWIHRSLKSAKSPAPNKT